MANQITSNADPMGSRFFTAHRLTAYPLIFLTVYVIASLVWIGLADDLVDPRNKPIGYDFITFWSASWLTLHDNALAIFDPRLMFEAQRVAVPGSDKLFLWHYPPTFLLIVLPLSLLPYIWAYLVWVSGTFAAYAWVIRKMVPQPQTLLILAAFPGAFMTLFHGQNGFLTAALFGGAMLVLERRPVMAGILIGLMSYKPHLGILLPLALLCGRHWVAFGSAAATTVLFAALSALVLGADLWLAFFNNLPVAQTVFQDGMIRWSKIPSVYASLRLTGVGLTPAYGAQIAVTIAVAAAVAWVWWKRPALPLRAATLVTGSLLVTPYLFDYDYALLAIPIALLAMDGFVRGWRPGERAVLAIAWIMPLVARGIADAINVQIGAVCVIALFAVSMKRALASNGANHAWAGSASTINS